MKDHARHDQGSARSLCTPLSQSATPERRVETLGESTYKTQTKCRQNRKCDIFSYSPPTTYNFSCLKCLNFSRRNVYLSGEMLFSRFQAAFFGPPFSAPSRLQRTSPRPHVSGSHQLRFAAKPPDVATCFPNTVQPNFAAKSSKSANSPIFTDFDHVVPSTYANQNRRMPIFCRSDSYRRDELRRVPISTASKHLCVSPSGRSSPKRDKKWDNSASLGTRRKERTNVRAARPSALGSARVNFENDEKVCPCPRGTYDAPLALRLIFRGGLGIRTFGIHSDFDISHSSFISACSLTI